MAELEPYRRRDFAGALAANAATRPFNVAILVITMAAATLVGGGVLVALLVALVVYAVACTRTFLDEDEADRVLGRERGRRKELAAKAVPQLDVAPLAPPIRDHVLDAREREQRIRDAIARADLPYEEVSAEVDGFVRAMESTAVRAQSLYEALVDTPPERVAARLAQVKDDPAKRELADALRHQLRVQQRMADQLGRFFDEMERMLVELDTVRGSLISVSAAEGSAAQRELAGEVRGLRERMGTVADGMTEAYESS